MTSDSAIGAGGSAPWYRVVAIPDAPYGGTAERDYASVLPAALDAAKSHRPFVVGWFSRGGGAPGPDRAVGAGLSDRDGSRAQADGDGLVHCGMVYLAPSGTRPAIALAMSRCGFCGGRPLAGRSWTPSALRRWLMTMALTPRAAASWRTDWPSW